MQSKFFQSDLQKKKSGSGILPLICYGLKYFRSAALSNTLKQAKTSTCCDLLFWACDDRCSYLKDNDWTSISADIILYCSCYKGMKAFMCRFNRVADEYNLMTVCITRQKKTCATLALLPYMLRKHIVLCEHVKKTHFIRRPLTCCSKKSLKHQFLKN